MSDEQIKGPLRVRFGVEAVVSASPLNVSLFHSKVGAQIEAKHPEKNQYSEGIISKIQDCSQYTVGKFDEEAADLADCWLLFNRASDKSAVVDVLFDISLASFWQFSTTETSRR